jgi:lysophospholipase L1-like esterase
MGQQDCPMMLASAGPRGIGVALAGVLSIHVGVASAQAPAEPAPLQLASAPLAGLEQALRRGSKECSTRSATFGGYSPLRSMRRALRESRPIKVLAIGSSSTVGVGASSPLAGYTVHLERDLEGMLTGVDVELIPSGMSGEEAEGTAGRIRTEVAANRPDLVVWQVGTNDAMARIGEERFATCLRTTLQWLAQQRIDVVMVNPQYTDQLARDDYYRKIVEIIAEVGIEQRVQVIDRYQAMAELSQRNGNMTYLASDRFHLNDLGYRCMAEHSARAIVAGILQADVEAVAPAPTTTASTGN